MHSCDQCGTKFTRENNLTRHVKEGRCKYVSAKKSQSPNNMKSHAKEDSWLTPRLHFNAEKIRASSSVIHTAGQKSYLYPPLLLFGEAKPRPPKNPKIQALLDEIVDDGIAHSPPPPPPPSPASTSIYAASTSSTEKNKIGEFRGRKNSSSSPASRDHGRNRKISITTTIVISYSQDISSDRSSGGTKVVENERVARRLHRYSRFATT